MNKITFIIPFLICTFINTYAQKNTSTRFTLIDSSHTNVTFINNINDFSETNIFTEENFYNGGGVAIGDINNDGLLDIFFGGNQVPDKLYLNLGNFQFKDIASSAGILNDGGWSSGISMIDINNDGLLDIYICRDTYSDTTLLKNKLYLNSGDLTFEEVSDKFGLASNRKTVQATFFDYDKDGDLDVYLLNRPPNFGYFSDRSKDVMIPKNGSQMFKNNNGRFEEVSQEAGLSSIAFTLSAAASDFNNDGWPDLYVCNDYSNPDYLFLNNKDGTFTNVINEAIKHTSLYSMGSDAADINNDGFSDLISLDMVAEDNRRLKANMSGMNPDKFWAVVENGGGYQYMFNALQLNQGVDDAGNLHFSEIGQLAGVSTTDWSWSPLFADFDNDGFKDLFVTNGLRLDFRNSDAIAKLKEYVATSIDAYTATAKSKPENPWDVIDFDKAFEMYPSEKIANYIYKNKNGYQFENKNEEWGFDDKTFSNGAAYGDLDNDGDLDLVINNINEVAFLYKNNSQQDASNNYLQIKLTDKSKNKPLFGSKIIIDYTEENIKKKQHYELVNARGFLSSSSEIAHFGLGKVKKIDRVTISWPDGTETVKKKIKANRQITIDHKSSSKTTDENEKRTFLFEEITQELGVNHKHQEKDYDDYDKEVLIPHKMSTLGASVSVGDLNGDQLEDFFIGGASGQFGCFYFQNKDGSFYKNELEEDKNQEDLGSVLFDADNDGDLDLYVTSGSNEINQNLSYYYFDRLYLNNGKGLFKRSHNSLPEISESSSVVKPFDYDLDGDMDLFVGGRQVPEKYPSPANSYILKNEGLDVNGEPIFINVTDKIAPELQNIGMVTDMLWLDFNNDTEIDFVLTGEWMSPTFFKNKNGAFTNITESTGLANKVGWWFSMNSADFDKDGDQDIVFGNLGLNYKYKASKNEPFEIFYNDFDANGTDDIVLSYYNFGERYPLRGRSCSSAQIPSIKEEFEDYSSFSLANLVDIYSPAKLSESIHYKATEFSSGYAENMGNGTFKFHKLPVEAQISNIEDILIDDFNSDEYLDIIIAGGLYDSEVETSRNDAGVGLFLAGDGKGNFNPIKPVKSGLYLNTNIKDMALIKIGKHKGVISSSSNDFIKIYKVLRK